MDEREHGPLRLAALVAVVAGGCGGAPVRAGAVDAVRDVARAVAEHDGDALRALEAHPPAEGAFETPTELAARLSSSSPDTFAHVHLEDGTSVIVRREGEAWRVDRGVLGLPQLTSPAEAIRAFHDALGRARLAGVEATLDVSTRAGLASEVARWLEVTADVDVLDVRVHDGVGEATAPTGEVIVLRREGGAWRVVDLR
jgi:hypothetical protein